MQTIQERARSAESFVPELMSPNRAGLIGGVFLGCWHAAWCAAVAAGWGQGLVDFVLRLHFLSVPIQVQEFGFGRAIGLVAFTFAVGYALGWTFVSVRNASNGALRG